MMATATVIGISAGKRLLSSSAHLHCSYSDHHLTSDKLLLSAHDHNTPSTKNHLITAKVSTRFNGPTSNPSDSHYPIVKTLHQQGQPRPPPRQQHVNTSSAATTAAADASLPSPESSLEALLLLQKSLLEKQWNLSCDPTQTLRATGSCKELEEIITSGVSARKRRSMRRKRCSNFTRKKIGPDLLGSRLTSIVKGVISEELLSHSQVVHLSQKIKIGLSLEDYKSKLKKRLGYDPSNDQLATSLRMPPSELQTKLIECSLAREKLAMSNVRLVMSIAKKYDNMGAEMADLVQGGLIGLVRGIEKFDSSKGFKISTYVYWWIRQGVSRALIENSRTLRLPTHLHERLSLIRNAKLSLEEKGITPSTERIAKWLNMSEKKVRNATEAISKVFSLDREAFPSLNGLPGETLHSYIADNRLENNPWHGVDEWTLKDEVNNLISRTLREREQDIIRLYYGLDASTESLTWEDISKRIGLSRERVRQVGLVALEKLKHAARRRKLDALLVKH